MNPSQYDVMWMINENPDAEFRADELSTNEKGEAVYTGRWILGTLDYLRERLTTLGLVKSDLPVSTESGLEFWW